LVTQRIFYRSLFSELGYLNVDFVFIGGTMNFGEALITNTEHMKLPASIEALHFVGGPGWA
jgi:hypothetical protein